MFRAPHNLLLALSLCVTVSSVAAQPSTRPAKWITLGTAGGPPLHADQAQISNALVVGEAIYLFDCGNGVLRQMDAAGLSIRNVRAVFLSHHHLDHNADVGPVVMSWWLFGTGEPLRVFGPAGTTRLVQGIVAANAPTVDASFPTSGPAKPALAVTIRTTELPPQMNVPTLVHEYDDLRVTAISVDHFQVPPSAAPGELPHAVAYRVEAGGRAYVYSGDTGPSRNFRTLARDAEVLITEVVDLKAIEASLRRMQGVSPAVVDNLVAGMAKNHLVPEEIGAIAAAAGVKQVVLTHFVPAMEDQPDPANFTRGIAPAYTGPVAIAKDLDSF